MCLVLFYEEGKNLPYIALYRKYRPNTFGGMVGRENITKILKNQIKNQKISHAYLFSGIRGTGKTSAAKIFARAINCLHPHEGEPCNECEVCKNILEGNTTDVIEMDAASNNSVESIRQIRQEVVYATIDVKYRVYIIDEVHMLTTSAFNALLKTLEEPPENVVFILATTEQHKIPVTILSRCLRFEFGRISEQDIMQYLRFVLENEKIAYEEEAIAYIAKLAEGGLRDALSILERCISEADEKVCYQDVLRILGAIDSQLVKSLADQIMAMDGTTCLATMEAVVMKGKDLRQLNYQLTEEFLNRLIAAKEGKDKYIKIIDKLSKLDNDLRLTSKPVIVYQASLMELCNMSSIGEEGNRASSLDIQPLLQKIGVLEQEMKTLKQQMSKPIPSPIRAVPKPAEKTVTAVSEVAEEEMTLFADAENFKKYIIEQGKLKLYSSLVSTNMYLNQDVLVIVTDNAFAYSILALEENATFLKDTYEKLYQTEIKIAVRLQEKTGTEIPKIEKVFKQNDINYTPID